RPTTNVAVISLTQQSQESLFERFVLRLDGVDARARPHGLAHDVGDALHLDAADEDRAVGAVVDLTESCERGAALSGQTARAQAHRGGAQEVGEHTLRDDLAAIDDGDAVADLLDLGEEMRIEEHDRASFAQGADDLAHVVTTQDRKSTRLNSSHRTISYAVFCLKKKKK